MSSVEFKVGGHPATAQQAAAISLGIGPDDLQIDAGAGTSKTTLLAALSKAKKGKGLYITFNKDIATEAQTLFPRTVRCRTAHSLAYQAVGKKYKSRLKRRLSGGLVAKHLDLEGSGGISAFAMGNLAIATVSRYCYSASLEIEEKHIPKGDLVKIEDPLDKNAIIFDTLVNAKMLLADMNKARSKLPISHDFYLKKWALSKPDLGVDYVLMDESQDTNDVLIDLLESQDCQVIWVGDTFQSIYSWRGAVNAMEKINVANRAAITQSFRFGPAIADVANAVLREHLEADMTLTGFDDVDSVLTRVELPDAIICRTNAEAMRHLVAAVDKGIRVTFSGGVNELKSQVSALKTLKKTGKTNHVDFATFKGFTEFKGFAFSKDGGEFKALALMVSDYGFDDLLETLDSIKSVDPTNAELIISTAHKAKGLEWNSVKLGNDFKSPGSKGYRKEESNLLYVAVTRAKLQLDITECEAALDALGMDKSEAAAKANAAPVALPSKEEREIKKAIAEFKRLGQYLESKGVDLTDLDARSVKQVA